MQDVTDLERRIIAALERIARAAVPARADLAPSGGAVDAGGLAEALEQERRARAEAQRRLDELAARQSEAAQTHAAEIAALKALHATQSRDLVALAERLKSDLAALRAERGAEAAEVSRILAALGPLVQEAQNA
ncbi:MAG: hypothetical protein ACT4N9_04610 [Paracoccaceae bacterium]